MAKGGVFRTLGALRVSIRLSYQQPQGTSRKKFFFEERRKTSAPFLLRGR